MSDCDCVDVHISRHYVICLQPLFYCSPINVEGIEYYTVC